MQTRFNNLEKLLLLLFGGLQQGNLGTNNVYLESHRIENTSSLPSDSL